MLMCMNATATLRKQVKLTGGRAEVCFWALQPPHYVDRITRENQHSAYVPFEVNT